MGWHSYPFGAPGGLGRRFGATDVPQAQRTPRAIIKSPSPTPPEVAASHRVCYFLGVK
ncbi:hypothetical protein DESC_810157 [Desulfosarcina cetonica]|nr:hypothetical protein DESC_810157 [Desulfosarcina cetonica]